MNPELKQTEGAWPRGSGLAINVTDNVQIAYLKYSPAAPVPADSIQINLIFAHGTGMNKSLWKPHIRALYGQQHPGWLLGHVLTVDSHSHGDLALLNKGKIAWGLDWRDGGRDLVAVVAHEMKTTGHFVPSPTVRNVLVGHSFGGFQVTYAAYIAPVLFDACVAIEPVIYFDEQTEPVFMRRMQKIGRLLQTQFASRAAADTFYRSESFYSVMHPEALDEFVADEVYEENGTFKSKALLEAQLAVYLSALYSLRHGMPVLGLLEIPYLYVIGTDAMWNHPYAAEYVAKLVPPHLLETAELEGDHLVHAAKIDDTVALILLYCGKRAAQAKELGDEYPVQIQDPVERVSELAKAMQTGDWQRTFLYGRPRPKI